MHLCKHPNVSTIHEHDENVYKMSENICMNFLYPNGLSRHDE